MNVSLVCCIAVRKLYVLLDWCVWRMLIRTSKSLIHTWNSLTIRRQKTSIFISTLYNILFTLHKYKDKSSYFFFWANLHNSSNSALNFIYYQCNLEKGSKIKCRSSPKRGWLTSLKNLLKSQAPSKKAFKNSSNLTLHCLN